MRRLLLLSFIMIMLIYEAFPQAYYNRNGGPKWVLQAGSGTASYFGDVVDDYVLTVNGNFTAGALYKVHNRIYIDGDITWFRLAAEDANSTEGKALRGLSFFSNNYQLSASVQVSLFEEPARFYLRKFMNPYLFAGIGLLYYNPKAEYEGQTYALRPLQTEAVSYSSFTAAIPMGIGVKIKINAFFNVALEGRFNYLFTDYLDDVSSGIYPDPSSFTDDIARKLSDRSGEAGADPIFSLEPRNVRGNPNEKDNYLLVLVKVQYYLSPFNDAYRAMKSRIKKNRRRRR